MIRFKSGINSLSIFTYFVVYPQNLKLERELEKRETFYFTFVFQRRYGFYRVSIINHITTGYLIYGERILFTKSRTYKEENRNICVHEAVPEENVK